MSVELPFEGGFLIQNSKLNTQHFFPIALTLLAVACSWCYYAWGYEPAVRADDRIQPLFYGFYKIEGSGERTYRWTNGHGTLCLPAAGQQRPPLALELDLVGRSDALDIRTFATQVGSIRLQLPLLEHDRHYHVVLPPGPETGPVCISLLSQARATEDDERALGIGLRAIELRRLATTTPVVPPLAQLALNAGLALGSYSLLRRWKTPALLAGGVIALVTLGVSLALISGRVRTTADLPAMTLGATATIVAVLATDVVRRNLGRRIASAWGKELLGVLLTTLLLLAGMFGFQALAGYQPGSYPLMARMGPMWAWDVVWPLLFFGTWLALLVRWLRAPVPPPAPLAIGLCWFAACALAVLLKASLREWDALFQTFTWQPEDYIRDVRRVGDNPLLFLQQYVAMMPKLALHNRTHPPGSTLLLWAIARVIGPGPQIATWVVIGLAGLGVWPTYRLTACAAGPQVGVERNRLALLAAAIYGLLPAQLIFSVTSLDAVFATALACAIYCLAMALLPNMTNTRHTLWSLAAGAWLAVGLFLTFSTLLLGVFAATLCLYSLVTSSRDTLKRTLLQASIVCAIAGLLLLLVWTTTGYNSWAAFQQGNIDNALDVQRRTPPPGLATYLYFLGANAIAYGIYLGPWAINLLADECKRAWSAGAKEYTISHLVSPVSCLLIGLAVLLIGMLVSGLFVREVERIWLFTHILVALAVARGIMRRSTYLGRMHYTALVLSTLFAQAVLFRALLRIYW